MSYSNSHETSNLRTYAFQGRARTPRSRAALQRRFHPAPQPDAFGEFEGGRGPANSGEPGLRGTNGARCNPRLQRAGPGCPHSQIFASQANPQAAFDEEGAEAVREMLHRSPREFGRRDSSLWTLEMAAQVAFEEGLTQRRVSGETIRATLVRLLGVRWRRAKRWITSPDPLYERKKGGATD